MLMIRLLITCVELMSLNTYDGSRHLVAEEVHDYLTNNYHKR